MQGKHLKNFTRKTCLFSSQSLFSFATVFNITWRSWKKRQ